jgi:hypothetical protein
MGLCFFTVYVTVFGLGYQLERQGGVGKDVVR